MIKSFASVSAVALFGLFCVIGCSSTPPADTDSQAWSKMGDEAWEDHDHKAAKEAWNKASSSRVDWAEKSVEAAREALKAGDMDGAEFHFQRAATVSDSDEVLYGLALTYMLKDEPKSAVPYLLDLMTRYPQNPELWNNLGVAYSDMDLTVAANVAQMAAIQYNYEEGATEHNNGTFSVDNTAYWDIFRQSVIQKP